MKITKFKRALSVLLVAVMIISTLPLNAMGLDEMERSTRPADSTNGIFDELLPDWLWNLLIRPSLKTTAEVKGLPENAEAGFDLVINNYKSLLNGKSSDMFGDIIDMYDIKAVDKETGEEIHPAGEVEVTLKNVKVRGTHPSYLVHFLDDENAIKNADNVIEIADAAFVSAFPKAAAAAEAALGKSGIICVEFITDLVKDGQDITFKTNSFSIYAIVDQGDDARLNVIMMNGSEERSNVVVTKSQYQIGVENNIDVVASIVYDPGVGTLQPGEFFRGWTTKQDYTAADADDAMTIEEVRADVTSRLNAVTESGENGSVTYYAMIFKSFIVTYLDENGVCIKTDNVLYKSGENVPAYTINNPYNPYDQDEKFNGWALFKIPAEGTPDYYTENGNTVIYPNGTQFTSISSIPQDAFTGNTVYLRAFVDKGQWLIFKENGTGASYTPPQFIKAGERPTRPANPTRKGYTFGGWYSNPEGTGSQYNFNAAVTERTTVYAKWTPVATANYTIIVWKQNIEGNGYDFEETFNLPGNVNTNVSTVSQQGNGNNAYARVTGRPGGNDIRYTGFHLKSFDQNVTINPEGTAVVNIYYDRNEYTLTFQAESYTRVNNPSNNDNDLYGYVDGIGYVKLTRSGGRWYFSYNGEWYRYSSYGNGYYYHRNLTTVKTITALYEQNISSNFPINGYTGYVWSPQNSSIYTTGDVPYIEAMREESTTFVAKKYGNGNTIHMYYYVEALPTDTNTVTFNGKKYIEHQHVQIDANEGINSTEAEDFASIVGFTQETSDPAYDSEGKVSLDETNSYTIKFYYTRNKYVLHFRDGKYVNGNGVEIDGSIPNPEDIRTVTDILYESDISDYNKGSSNYYVPDAEKTPVGYVFGGWYIDPECTLEYTFNKMNANITVYAKWVQKQYRVFLHPNVPTDDTSLDWGDQSMSFRLNYKDQIAGGNFINGTRTDYELVGWYYDEDCTIPFGFEAFEGNDTTITTPYPKTEDTEVDKYGNPTETGNADANKNRFWIVTKLDIYAKWRAKLNGANGIHVVYNAGEGSNAPVDNGLYTDESQAIGGAASTAPEGKVFKYWVVQEWNTETEQYEDPETEIRVYPGQEFTVKKLHARHEHLTEDDRPEYIPDIITERYTVQLRAEYGPIEGPEKVDVYFDANTNGSFVTIPDGFTKVEGAERITKHLDTNEGFKTPSASTVEKEGYKFLGWAFDNTINTTTAYNAAKTAGEAFDADTDVAADNLDRTQLNDHNNTLYAVWEINRYDVEVDKVLVNKGVDDDTWNAHPFTVHYKYELEGYDTVEGTLTVKANDTTLPKIQNIPHGAKLTVWEVLDTNDAKIFETDHDTSSKFEIASVTAEKDGDLAATVTITNTRKDVDLYIRKFVDLDKDAGKTFRFNVTINGVTSSVNATSAKTGTEATGTKITVPYGSAVTVSEITTDTYETYNGTPYTVADIFDTTGAADWTVTATEEQTHDFTNVRKTVKIYVKKDVKDSLDPADSDYLFKFTINGEERSAKAGKTTDYVEVPIGTEVTVVETDKNGNYITEWAIYGSEETKTVSDTANIGQRYGDTTVIFTNTREKVPLTITKTVDKEVDNGKEFYFDVTINGTTEKKTVKGGESITINVMYGAPVSVTERINDEYNGTGYTVAQLFKTDAAKSADHLTAATEWTFNNVRRVGTLTVTKEVVSDYAPDYTNKKYDFTYTVNGGTPVPFSITIDGNKTKTYTIPVEFFVGDVVVVTEDDLNDAYMTQSDAVEVTIAEGDGNTAKITNTRKDVTVTVIKKLAEEDSFNTDKDFTFKVNGVEKTATVDGKNAVFTLTYGTVFTLEEIGLNEKYMDPTFESAGDLTGSNGSYTAMGDGTITVTNKVKRIPVTVKKTVNGDADDKAADYNFTVSSSIGSVTSDAEGKTAITTLVIKGDHETTVYVPYGAALTATETVGGVNGREYKTTIDGEETKTHTTGTLTAEGTTIEFVNTRIVTVTVVKAVPEGDEALVGTDEFAVTVDGVNVADSNISLTQNKTFKVPYNSTFTVTESLGSLVWKYQTPEYSGGSNTYTATADTTVTITNKLQTYKVKVIKSVSNPNYYANGTKFYFDQTGLPTDNPFTLGLGRDGEDPKFVEFTVKAGTVVTVKERPGAETKSTTFTLTTGVISTSSEYPSFTVKKDTEVEFTNVINVYPVTVKKVIDNSALDSDFAGLTDNFKLEYEVYDANGVKITEVKGNAAVDLKPGVDTVIPNVPYGGHVKVNEISDDRYTTTYKSGDKTNGTCAEVKNDQTVITVTNTRKATSLTIEKIVDSTVEADKETREYVFTVMIGTVEKTVKIRGKGTGTLPNLPVGESVTVTEAEQANMDTTSEHVSYTLAENAASNKSTFTNKRRVVTITVEKTVVSRVKADYTTYTFSYEYTVDNVDDHKYEGTATIEIAEPNNSGTTTISVPEGATAFKLTEKSADANLTVKYSNNEIAGPITTSPAKVTVTNERPEIAVTIEKVVVSDINDYSNYDFKFDYTVKFGNQTVESGTKSITGAGTNNEITVPKGADITVTEQTGVKYTTINNADFTVAQVFDTTYSSDTLTGVVAEGGKITVTNTRKLVEVTVKKVVDNKWNIASDLTKEFSFKFDSAKMYTGADATVITNADTKKLKHDGEIKIKVPFGATFKATETADPAFDTKVRINSEADAEALTATTDPLTVDGTVITFTNTRKPIKVEVQKHVNKFFDEDINETFHFEAAVMFGDNAWALPTADLAFDLMDYLTDNTRKHVFEVPYGSNIQVKEVNHTGFTSTATLDGEDYDQNMTDDPLTADARVIIYNDRDRVTITVKKTVATDAKLKTVDEAINFPFTYSWTKNENFKRGDTSFTLHHGQEAYTFTVPVGAAVNVNELTDTELTVYNNLKISDVFATVSEYGTTTDDQTVSFNADEATTVAFTNTHKNVNVNLVKAVNLEQDKNVDFEFTWSAVYGTVDFTTDNGKATRKHNTTATLLCTVPVGVTISVTEILPSDQGFVTPNIAYTTGAAGTVDGAVVTISNIKDDATITYTNNRQVFDITFGKEVVNGVANDNLFKFRFTYTDNGGEEHEVFISDKGSITIPQVPYGHTIVITEDVLKQLSAYGNFKVADIFTTTISDQSGIISGQSGNCTVDGAKVTIYVTQAETITFTNTHKTSIVTITKEVVSKNESDKQHEFPFNATAHAGDAYVIGSAGEKDSFVLKHSGKKVYTVPYGFEFAVGETPDVRYNTSLTFNEVKETAHAKTFTVEKDSYTIAYLNERAQGDLKIVKTGVGETNDAFLFKVTKNNDDTFKPLFVTIHGNGSVYVMQLEAGDYKVEEVTDWSWRYDKQTEEITNEAEGAVKTDDMATIMGGESGDKAPTVTFTNKKNNKNWLGTECGSDNKYDPQLTAAVDPAAEQVAWDSKIRLAYASPADKFRDNKETA